MSEVSADTARTCSRCGHPSSWHRFGCKWIPCLSRDCDCLGWVLWPNAVDALAGLADQAHVVDHLPRQARPLGTLWATPEGKVYQSDGKRWRPLDPSVVDLLAELAEDGPDA